MIFNRIAKSIAVIALVAITGVAFASCKYEQATPTTTALPAEIPAADDLMSGKHHVEIDVENYGTIKVELDADVAPITVTNFINLANNGFYDGLTFHRIIDGFMIQGGDPLGNGTGTSGQYIIGEFAANGRENKISHVRGVISMARSSDGYDKGSSQFFIVQSDSTYLDGQYAAFGHVTSGLEIVDQICIDTPVTDNNGSVKAADQPVITAIRVID
ncbi:MAG: peptidylprolyl isomerase [Saccharofermentans sp.]|nr:peptidylprolyl isomerase [Saccharofermentans sp.]